ncbi:DUF86 domain-containing protein [Patescibacteria group bacterium]|nr:DUF86 domain-containing protein [Patescibacteria group bacterium]
MDMEIKQKELKDYFKKRSDVSMAFIFGSYAKGREISESDFDIAIYFKPEGRKIEWEADKVYAEKSNIWQDLEKIVKKNVDLVILNNAASTIAFEVLQTGEPIIIKDKVLYWKFLSQVSFEAIDFRNLVKDYLEIKQRSASLTEKDRVDLLRKADFLEGELGDLSKFSGIDQQIYQSDSSKRRDVERWVENIVNCSIDVAKILLASEKRQVPDTYKGLLRSLFLFPGFDKDIARDLSEFAELRNLLSHEYLDIRFGQIKKFIDEAGCLYGKLLDFIKQIN